MSVKFASQICHEHINKPLDGAYLVDFGINITTIYYRMDTKLFFPSYDERLRSQRITVASTPSEIQTQTLDFMVSGDTFMCI